MTTQTELTIQALDLGQGAWLISRLDVNYGQQTLTIEADYEDKPFRLIFKAFCIVSWQTFDDEYDPGTVNVDVIGFDLLEQHQRKSAVLHTDVFEIIVSYGELEIEKAW